MNVIKAAFRMLQAGHAPTGMGDGLGGPGKKLSKGSGLIGKEEVERFFGFFFALSVYFFLFSPVFLLWNWLDYELNTFKLMHEFFCMGPPVQKSRTRSQTNLTSRKNHS